MPVVRRRTALLYAYPFWLLDALFAGPLLSPEGGELRGQVPYGFFERCSSSLVHSGVNRLARRLLVAKPQEGVGLIERVPAWKRIARQGFVEMLNCIPDILERVVRSDAHLAYRPAVVLIGLLRHGCLPVLP